jgi:uncharacterized protein
MIIKVSEIPEDGLSIEGTGAIPEAFQDRSWELESLALLVQRDDDEVVVRGRLAARVPQVCGRCLESFPFHVTQRVDARFAPRPERRGEDFELASDDLEVDFYANDSLNLAALVETETTLALPMKPLCREGCRGLCSVCGGNRNFVDCQCSVPPVTSPFAVLKDRRPSR